MKSLNRSIVIAGGLVLSSIVVASLAVAGNIGHHHKRQHLVHATSIDSNGDGALSQDEVLAHNRLRFDRLDSNSDGMISADEFSARLLTMFTRMDSNSDGLLKGEELPRRMGKHGHGKAHRHDGMAPKAS